jgi:hypothetical protein
MLIIKYTNSIDMRVGVPYGTFTKKSSFAEEILYSVNVNQSWSWGTQGSLKSLFLVF